MHTLALITLQIEGVAAGDQRGKEDFGLTGLFGYLLRKVAHFRLLRELACAYTASPLAGQQRVAPTGRLVIPTQRAVVAVVQRVPFVVQSHLRVPVALY